jgi:hypothetical protein
VPVPYRIFPGLRIPFGSKAAFSSAHQIELNRWLDACQLAALQLADAVFGGNRAAELERDLVATACANSSPSRQELRLGHADGLGDIVVDVAVAEMADRQRPRLGTDRRLGAGNKGGDGGDRHGDVVLDVAALALLRQRKGLAQAPEVPRLRQRAGECGIVYDARFAGLLFAGRLQDVDQQPLGRAVRLQPRCLEQNISGMGAGEGVARAGDVSEDDVEGMRGMNSKAVRPCPAVSRARLMRVCEPIAPFAQMRELRAGIFQDMRRTNDGRKALYDLGGWGGGSATLHAGSMGLSPLAVGGH